MVDNFDKKKLIDSLLKQDVSINEISKITGLPAKDIREYKKSQAQKAKPADTKFEAVLFRGTRKSDIVLGLPDVPYLTNNPNWSQQHGANQKARIVLNKPMMFTEREHAELVMTYKTMTGSMDSRAKNLTKLKEHVTASGHDGIVSEHEGGYITVIDFKSPAFVSAVEDDEVETPDDPKSDPDDKTKPPDPPKNKPSGTTPPPPPGGKKPRKPRQPKAPKKPKAPKVPPQKKSIPVKTAKRRGLAKRVGKAIGHHVLRHTAPGLYKGKKLKTVNDHLNSVLPPILQSKKETDKKSNSSNIGLKLDDVAIQVGVVARNTDIIASAMSKFLDLQQQNTGYLQDIAENGINNNSSIISDLADAMFRRFIRKTVGGLLRKVVSGVLRTGTAAVDLLAAEGVVATGAIAGAGALLFGTIAHERNKDPKGFDKRRLQAGKNSARNFRNLGAKADKMSPADQAEYDKAIEENKKLEEHHPLKITVPHKDYNFHPSSFSSVDAGAQITAQAHKDDATREFVVSGTLKFEAQSIIFRTNEINGSTSGTNQSGIQKTSLEQPMAAEPQTPDYGNVGSPGLGTTNTPGQQRKNGTTWDGKQDNTPPPPAVGPTGNPGTYRPEYKLGDADLSDPVINTIAGEAYTHNQQSVDAVINNMMNRIGTKDYGPSKNLQDVARARGQYAGYKKPSKADAEYIRSRIRAIASGSEPDITGGSNEFRATYYKGPWYQKHANDSTSIGGNRFARNHGVKPGTYAPYSKPHQEEAKNKDTKQTSKKDEVKERKLEEHTLDVEGMGKMVYTTGPVPEVKTKIGPSHKDATPVNKMGEFGGNDPDNPYNMGHSPHRNVSKPWRKIINKMRKSTNFVDANGKATIEDADPGPSIREIMDDYNNGGSKYDYLTPPSKDLPQSQLAKDAGIDNIRKVSETDIAMGKLLRDSEEASIKDKSSTVKELKNQPLNITVNNKEHLEFRDKIEPPKTNTFKELKDSVGVGAN